MKNLQQIHQRQDYVSRINRVLDYIETHLKKNMTLDELAENEYEQAWDMVYGGWLPNSGFQPDDRSCFEIYHNDPKDHPDHKCILDICVPVKPL